MQGKKVFIYGSIITHALLAIAICLIFIAAMTDGYDNKLVAGMLGLFLLSFLTGWIALIPGRRLVCDVCGDSILKPDSFGFVGLKFGPAISLLRGGSGCERCQ